MRKSAPAYYFETTVTELIIPAPLWRRLAAAVYDGLLLIALWMSGTLLHLMILSALGESNKGHSLTVFLFLIGLAFFGWFWTHGGQTLGMRVWRLQLRREDGTPLRWPVAATRYLFAYFSWISVLGILWCLIDSRRRSWHDIIASTEMVVVPKPTQPSS